MVLGYRNSVRAAALLAVVTGLLGCGSSSQTTVAPSERATAAAASDAAAGSEPSSDSSPGTPPQSPPAVSSDTTTGGTGRLTISLTDSPFGDAQAVLVTFSDISVHRSDNGKWERVPLVGGSPKRMCDLKKLQGPLDVLGVAGLEPGHYTQIRLTIESAALYFDSVASGGPCGWEIPAPTGRHAEVHVPSGTVRLNRPFTLTAGGVVDVLLDFDGDKSIHGNGRSGGSGHYTMTPVITVVSVVSAPGTD